MNKSDTVMPLCCSSIAGSPWQGCRADPGLLRLFLLSGCIIHAKCVPWSAPSLPRDEGRRQNANHGVLFGGDGEVLKVGIKLKFNSGGISSVLNWKLFPSVVCKFHDSALFVMTCIINENLECSGRTPLKEGDGSRSSGVPTGLASLWQQFS